jgi:hypothetical protein
MFWRNLLKMEAENSSETFIMISNNTWYQNPVNHNHNLYLYILLTNQCYFTCSSKYFLNMHRFGTEDMFIFYVLIQNDKIFL